ncbi:MAG: ECF transporter S component [Eubacteriales bacterium]
MKLTTRKLTTAAVMAALIFVFTFLVHIPIPGTQAAYINPGDTIIYICAFVLGGLPAMFAAGIGSMLADIASQSAIYAPATLLIKGAMGIVCATIMLKPTFAKYVLACILGGAIMTAGYAVYDYFMFGLGVMLPDLFGSLVQWGVCVALAIVFYKPVLKLRSTFRFRKELER